VPNNCLASSHREQKTMNYIKRIFTQSTINYYVQTLEGVSTLIWTYQHAGTTNMLDTVAIYKAVNITGNLNIYYKQNKVSKSKNTLNEIKISTILNKGETEMLTLSKHISNNYFVEMTWPIAHVNRLLAKRLKLHKHITISKVNLNRHHFTKHGQHMNYKGK
jgi:hypothetical protein